MTERPALSKRELEVARVLWTLKRASVREVHESFPSNRDLDFTSVQTYLRRLESKGYVSVELVGRTRFYSPKVRPKTVIRDTVDDLVDRLFGGKTLPLMQHLIENREITPSELEQLKELIDRLDTDTEEEGHV